MSHKRNEALRHVQHSMHHVIAAGEGSDRAPDSCKLCPYYRPDFKFRTCLYFSEAQSLWPNAIYRIKLVWI